MPGKDGENVERAFAYRALLQGLKEEGAAFAGLSGSGSSCFGIFTAKESAERAEKQLSEYGNFTNLTFFLAHRADPVLEYMC
jgi:4-diphosphocytidyl-2-C-methyl-D-erythritol kinase